MSSDAESVDVSLSREREGVEKETRRDLNARLE